MRKFRAVLAAVIALALAALPVPAAAMHASMAGGGIDTEMAAGHDGEHCCPQAEDCDTPAKSGCDRSDACALKCAAISAATVAEIDLPALATPRPVRTALADRLSPAQTLPQLPPPRL